VQLTRTPIDQTNDQARPCILREFFISQNSTKIPPSSHTVDGRYILSEKERENSVVIFHHLGDGGGGGLEKGCKIEKVSSFLISDAKLMLKRVA
jgi:hypothetical protein